MSEGNIRAGFKNTGIYPVNFEAIPNRKMAPSFVTDKYRQNTSKIYVENVTCIAFEEFMPQNHYEDSLFFISVLDLISIQHLQCGIILILVEPLQNYVNCFVSVFGSLCFIIHYFKCTCRAHHII